MKIRSTLPIICESTSISEALPKIMDYLEILRIIRSLDFMLCCGEEKQNPMVQISHFMIQCGEIANNDDIKLKFFARHGFYMVLSTY